MDDFTEHTPIAAMRDDAGTGEGSELIALTDRKLLPLSWRAERLDAPSAWWQHVPFAHWLVGTVAPRCLVELGTHAGVSYTAFCNAVAGAGLGTRCYAVDTWHGDSQAGLYGEEVYQEFRRFHDERYTTFSTLLRSTFDEALEKFPDGSIDLLHIDGCHTYEAVRHDFETWKPKLSSRAVVLFHDTNEHGGDFGVWRVWAELRREYPSFEFLNGHGLGLLAVGPAVPPAVASLCALEDPAALASLRGLFARLGERWWYEVRERMAGSQLQRHMAAAAAQAEATARQVEAAIGAADAARAEVERLRSELEAATRRAEDASRIAAEAAGTAQAARAETERLRSEAQAAAALSAEAARSHEAALAQEVERALRAENEARRRAAEVLASDSRMRAETDARMEAVTRAGWAESALATVRREAALASRRAMEAEGEAAQARAHAARVAAESAGLAAQARVHAARIAAESAGLAAQAVRAETERAGALRERDVLLSSTVWRVTWPLRAAGQRMPAPLRRAARGTAKLAWWTATLSLPHKLRERQRTIRVLRDAAVLPRPPEALPAAEALATPEALPAPEPAVMDAPVMAARRASTAAQMRAVWVSAESDTPGHRYRVARPMAAAASLGARTHWMRPDEVAARLAEIEAADVLVLWRAAWDETIALAVDAARRGGAKIVFDVDDLMVDPSLARNDVIDGIRTQDLTEEAVRAHYERVRATMAAADFCVASTEELAEHMRRAGQPAVVLQNSFDEGTWFASRLAVRRRAARDGDGVIRLGYAGGSRTHQRDFALCAEAVAAVLRAHPDCRLVLFRSVAPRFDCLDVSEYPALRGLEDRIEWRDVVPLEQLPEELARLDVNLAPLEVGNPFCEAKSELKLFEAALADVPTVASPTGPHRRAIRHGETGFLAGTAREWLDVLMRLVGDAGLRRSVAAAAKRDVSWRFGPECLARDMAVLLDLMGGGPARARAFETLAQRRRAPRPPVPPVADHEVVFKADKLGIAEVTVVVPLYNYAHTLADALDSARRQTLRPLDLVVVDDRSTDASLDRALAWAHAHAAEFNRLIVARNRVNRGLGTTRNVGFDLAETPWIMALDADNRLRPECAAACLQTAQASGVAFAYPSIQCFGDHDARVSSLDWDPVRLSNGNYIDAMALVSRAAWAGVGGYDTTRTGWEDFDLWCSFAERGLRGELVPGEPLAEYRVHGTSMIQASMKQREKVRWMMGHLQKRHPWLTLVPLIPEEPATEPAPVATPAALDERTARLLPLLRCPVSGGRLAPAPDGRALVSEDGTQRWPLVEGRPVLFPGVDAPRVAAESHLSNTLPDSAVALIRGTPGLVLHLSAGGSAERFENVIESEAAIFRHTDLVADSHRLPFADESFEAVIALNAFEHYRDPKRAASEILRVLKPGGRVLIRTAFLQPLHEPPWHFYNCTRYGLEAWFEGFDTEKLWVSDNFHAGYSLSWLASECELALRDRVSAAAADRLMQAPVERVVSFWRTPETTRGEGDPIWADLAALPQEAQEGVAAGFEYVGRRPT